MSSNESNTPLIKPVDPNLYKTEQSNTVQTNDNNTVSETPSTQTPTVNDEVDEENTVNEISEGEELPTTIGSLRCPSCKQEVAFFVTKSPNSPYVKCPRCGTTFSKKLIPRGAALISKKMDSLVGNVSYDELVRMYNDGEINDIIKPKSVKVIIPKKIELPKNNNMGYEQNTVQENTVTQQVVPPNQNRVNVQPPQVNTQRQYIDEPFDASSVFNTPKNPCDVLAEVFSEFSNLNQNFVKLMVNYCRRKENQQGGIHPYELLYYLKKMKSGVKTEAEADFIVKEYVDALNAEAEKAKNNGMDYPVWLLNYNSMGPAPENMMELPPLPNMPQQPTPVVARPLGFGGFGGRYNQTPSSPSQSNTSNTVDNSTAIMLKMLDLQQKNTELTVKSLQDSMQNSFQQLSQNLAGAFNAIAEALKSLQNNNKSGLDEDKLKLILENKEKEFDTLRMKDQLEHTSKDFEKTLKEIETRYQDLLKSQEEKIKDLEKRLESRAVSEYNSDSAKLVYHTISEGFDTAKGISKDLINIVKDRQPVKEIVSSLLPQLKKIKTNEGLIDELEEEGLVDEGNNDK